MLLKIFAAIGAGGSVLHTLIAGQTGNALETTGILLLRFLEYFFGAHIAYVLVMLLSTELFIRKSKPQEKPSKFWLWHLHAVADLLCFYIHRCCRRYRRRIRQGTQNEGDRRSCSDDDRGETRCGKEKGGCCR